MRTKMFLFLNELLIKASFKAILIWIFEVYTSSSELALLIPAKWTITSHEETKDSSNLLFSKISLSKGTILYFSNLYFIVWERW